MTDARIEAVARAICANYFHSDPEHPLEDTFQAWKTDCMDMATAALAAADAVAPPPDARAIRRAALEEAARVAEEFDARDTYACGDIAAAIRAFAEDAK